MLPQWLKLLCWFTAPVSVVWIAAWIVGRRLVD
jgi:hypothetical protein